MWDQGELTINGIKYSYQVKHYDLPSKNGIRNGRISKLTIWDSDDNTVYQYDRGPVIRLKRDCAPELREVFNIIMKRYN